jgi:carbamoyl-phosphate synthase large subunit
VVRPSYVLGGRAMEIIRDEGVRELPARHPALADPAGGQGQVPNDKTGQINTVLGKNPLLFDRYLSDAIEVDVDCLCRRQGRLHRGHHGAYRGGRHPFRRFGLLAAAALALARD